MKLALLLLFTISASTLRAEGTATTPLGAVPNQQLTPGVVLPGCNPCVKDFMKDHPTQLTLKQKQNAMKAYGYDWKDHAKYEINHRVPRELCGADDQNNLWPMLKSWAKEKAKVERDTLKRVCKKHQFSLEAAQAVFLQDWYAYYVVAKRTPRGSEDITPETELEKLERELPLKRAALQDQKEKTKPTPKVQK